MDGKYKLRPWIGKRTLQSSDISLITRTNVDCAIVTLPVGCITTDLGSPTLPKVAFEKCGYGAQYSAGADNIIYIEKWCGYDSSQRQVQIPFAKGTSLSDMRTMLVGSNVYYALATAGTLVELHPDNQTALTAVSKTYDGITNISLGVPYGTVEFDQWSKEASR